MTTLIRQAIAFKVAFLELQIGRNRRLWYAWMKPPKHFCCNADRPPSFPVTMRKLYIPALLLPLLIFAAGCTGSRVSTESRFAEDPSVVAVIDGSPIYLAEFERRYAKSVGGEDRAEADSLAAYQDFLERYVDFRLKVKAGIDAGLPSDPSLQQEIDQYRRSYARPYLLEQEVIGPIIREIHQRQQEMVKARHILFMVPDGASPADTLEIYNRLAAVVDSIEAGADFGDMAVAHSEDPSAQRPEGLPGARGELGYFTAGQMVEPFESYAFETEVGQMSPIFRTQFGYHVLQVQDRIPTPNPIRVAHIMIEASQVQGTKEDARILADSLVQQLRQGEDFARLVAEYSHDINSAQRDGELGVLEYGTPVIPAFKDAAFELVNEGDVSDPVETEYGYHIIKLLERQDLPTYEELYDQLRQRVARTPRAQAAEEALVQEIRAEAGVQVDTTALLTAAGDVELSELVRLIRADSLAADAMSTEVADIGGRTITFAEVADEVQSGRAGSVSELEDLLLAGVNRVLNDRALDIGSEELEAHDREFAELMQEFHEGLILFRFMEDSVWTAAARDTLALKAIYDANPGSYRYPDRTRIISVSTPRDSTIKAFIADFDSLGLAEAIELSEGVRFDTTYVAGPTDSYFDSALDIAQGSRTDASRQSGRHTVLINDGSEPARTKTFEEARPEILTVYQERLERDILADLRRRYRVSTYPDRLNAAFSSDAAVQLHRGE